MIHIWHASISSWADMGAIGAEHFYVKLHGPNGFRSDDLERTCERQEAEYLARKAGLIKEGEKLSDFAAEIWARTNKFNTREAAAQAAVAEFQKVATGPAVLVDGGTAMYEAAPVLASIGVAAPIFRRLGVLGDRARAAWAKYTVRRGGYFDLTPRGRAMHDRATDEFYRILGA
jgi:hypothetical protein